RRAAAAPRRRGQRREREGFPGGGRAETRRVERPVGDYLAAPRLQRCLRPRGRTGAWGWSLARGIHRRGRRHPAVGFAPRQGSRGTALHLPPVPAAEYPGPFV